jgi:hypothetical protein
VCAGRFEIVVDPNLPYITSFCLPGKSKMLAHTTAFLSQAIQSYEEFFGVKFPFESYKQVFVEDAWAKVCTYLPSPPRVSNQQCPVYRPVCSCIPSSFLCVSSSSFICRRTRTLGCLYSVHICFTTKRSSTKRSPAAWCWPTLLLASGSETTFPSGEDSSAATALMI